MVTISSSTLTNQPRTATADLKCFSPMSLLVKQDPVEQPALGLHGYHLHLPLTPPLTSIPHM